MVSLASSAQNISNELVSRAESGDADAQYSLGAAYLKENRHEEGFDLIVKASKQGHEKAIKLLDNIKTTMPDSRFVTII